jgi:divalent metal cation (Fe/Co/Zn/Cd) transporter
VSRGVFDRACQQEDQRRRAVGTIFVSKRLFRVGMETDSVALRADAWHLRTDVYTSLGVMTGLLVIWVAGMISPGLDLLWLDPAVRSFHHMRTRKAGSNPFIDFHLAVDDRMSVGEAHSLGDEIVEAINEHVRESRVHIHVEPCDFECRVSCASGCSVEPDARRLQEDSQTERNRWE